MRFWIWTWNRNYHAGVQALHRLQNVLAAAGYDAFIINPIEAQKPVIEDEDIMIYPEVTSGNPMQAKRVVRWLLNAPGVCGGGENYAASDYLTAYNPDHVALANGKRLVVNLIDKRCVNNGLERKHDALWIGKGVRPHQDFYSRAGQGLQVITSNWPAKKAELFDLLNRSAVFYTCDCRSLLNVEASLCGCRIVYVNTEGVTSPLPLEIEDSFALERDTVKSFIADMQEFSTINRKA